MKVDNAEVSGFAIQPKLDCPHLTTQLATAIDTLLSAMNTLGKPVKDLKCVVCEDSSENWVCLTCLSFQCSRYVKGHMAQHNDETKHPIALSFSDGSFWCYDCESYIDHIKLRSARMSLSAIKTRQEAGGLQQTEDKKEGQVQEKKTDNTEDAKQLERLFDLMNIANQAQQVKKVTFEEIADGFKQKSYKRVLVLTGAGLSVAAGIPDFRSPGTGLYSKLQAYKLPYPQAIFEISYFKKSPTAFLTLSKELLTANYEPTLGHRFIKKLQDEDILLMNMTQNIDDLEIKAGVHEQKLLQAHGHSRRAHCLDCKKQVDIAAWKECAAKEQAMYCECGGLTKPDIVFFGEQLPKEFFKAPELVGKCDIAIIIGTSLKVMPFAYLAQIIPAQVPIVLINRQDVLERQNTLWLNGDIQENIQKLMKAIGWLE